MPRKVTFRVFSASGQDEDHKASELNLHTPTTVGWQSGRFSEYPQELVLRLERCVRVRKIQVLSHHYMIASRIELFVGDIRYEGSAAMESASFKRLGFINLSDNERTGQQARELKSVHVDAVGQLVRLVIHKNHYNRLNTFNQVGIIAVNIIGDDLYIDEQPNEYERSSNLLLRDSKRRDYIPPTDDLAFDLYQDPEVARIIRRLNQRKEEAVKQERFEQAKQLKEILDQLHKVGSKLGQLEVEKRLAIEKENYDLAEQKKNELEVYRREAYDQLHVRDLVELETPPAAVRAPIYLSPVVHERRQPSPPPTSPPLLPLITSPPGTQRRYTPPPPLEGLTSARSEPMHVSTPPLQRGFTHPTAPPVQRGLTPYDERVLPAIANRRQQGLPDPIEVDHISPRDTTPNPARVQRNPPTHKSVIHPTDRLLVPPQDASHEGMEVNAEEGDEGGAMAEMRDLGISEQKEAAFVSEVFGSSLASKLFSKTWSMREDAVLSALRRMREHAPGDKDGAWKLLRAVALVVQRAVADNVLAVLNAGLALLRMVLTDWLDKHSTSRVETVNFLEQVLPTVFQKTGDKAVRQRDSVKIFIAEASQFPRVAPLQIIPRESVVPFSKATQARLALSRMEVVVELYTIHGLDTSGSGGLTVDATMKFAVEALSHSSGDVRQKAEDLIVALYADPQGGERVRDHLPPDTAATRRNVLYKQLFEAFSEVDQRPGGPVEMRRLEQEERKRREDEELQMKMKQLREAKTAGIFKTMEVEKVCEFCDEHNEGFNDEGIDRHYYFQCPMLTKCDSCTQMVEIPDLTNHRLSDCESRGYSRCPRCTEAIPKAVFKKHTSQKACTPMDLKKSLRCALCHRDMARGAQPADNEDQWKRHLLGRDGCKQNPRRTDYLARNVGGGSRSLAARDSVIHSKPVRKGLKYTPRNY